MIEMLDLTKARQLGVIQEINRRLLHPRGLALQVTVKDASEVVSLDGFALVGDDTGGIFVDGEIDHEKAERFDAMIAPRRLEKLGRLVQPLPELRHVWRSLDDTTGCDREPLEEDARCVRCGAYASSESDQPCLEL